MTVVHSVLAHGGTGGWIADGAIAVGLLAIGLVVWLRTRGLTEEDELEIQRKIDRWRDGD
jgi:hypothetical protein